MATIRDSINATIVDTTRANTLVSELNKNLQDQLSIRKQIYAAVEKGNDLEADGLRKLLDLRKQEESQLRSQISGSSSGNLLQGVDKSFSEKSEQLDIQQNEKAYQGILNLQKQIYELSVKRKDASSTEKKQIDQQVSSLNDMISSYTKIGNLTEEQVSMLRLIANSQEMQAKENYESTQIEQLIKAYQNLNNVQKQISSLDAEIHSDEVKYYQEKEKLIQENIDGLKETLKYNKEAQQIIQNNENLSKAKQSGQKDEQKLKTSLELLKQYSEAYREYLELKAKHADADTLSESEANWKQLKQQLDQATAAQLSNGKAVSQTEKYTEQYNQEINKTNELQRKLETNTKNSSSAFSSLGSKLKNTITNVIQYNLAQLGLQEAIDKTINTIKELDESITQIRLVTGESAESARETMNAYSELAKELGSTTKEVAAGKFMLTINSLNCWKPLRVVLTTTYS